MALQTRKWAEDLGRAIGEAALAESSVKEATARLHKGELADFGAVPMPYATVSYYARKIRDERQAAAQEEQERLRPKPVSERIDAAGRVLLEIAEEEIAKLKRTTKRDPKRIGELAASVKRIGELTKPDGPSRQDPKSEKPSDPLTAALTRPSPRQTGKRKREDAVAPNTRIEGDQQENASGETKHEGPTMSGVPASAADEPGLVHTNGRVMADTGTTTGTIGP